MASIPPEQLAMLTTVLDRDFVPHLPPLLAPKADTSENETKNRSRALSGFVIRALTDVSPEIAARDVVDDYDDEGIDLIHYSQATETLFLVQGKLKSADFKQDEAQAFCAGVRKLLIEDFTSFNSNVQNRRTDIEDALENCRKIQVVVAYAGEKMSGTARRAIEELLENESKKLHKLSTTFVEFGSLEIIDALQQTSAKTSICETVNLTGWFEIDVPRRTYYGMINLSTLAEFYQKHGDLLFSRNVRFFLGHETEVNSSIMHTLGSDSARFFYLNNGVTALCKEFVERNTPQGRKRIQLNGLSVINGAQTIATAAKYLSDNPEADISEAKVLFTVIEIPDGEVFADEVTRARNHQNAVTIADFVALDGEQERLRRDIANLGISYHYKAVGANRTPGPTQIYFDESSQSLAIIAKHPRISAALKERPIDFLDVSKDRYKELFSSATGAYETVNAVKFARYVLDQISTQANSANGAERLSYRNGNYLLAWLLARQCLNSISRLKVIEDGVLPTRLSQPLDDLRQVFFEETSKVVADGNYSAFFKNQGKVVGLAKLIMIRHFGIVVDDRMRRREEANPDNYIEYLASKAPQIDLHG